jgi:hypothetical protein
MDRVPRAQHVYEKDPRKFEEDLNTALDRLLDRGATIAEIQYQIDPSTDVNRRGGFGALILYEIDRQQTE